MIERVIQRLEVDPEEAHGQKEGEWNLECGEVKVWLDLWFMDDESRLFFQVMAPVIEVPIPELRNAFYEELLRINNDLFGSTFTLREGWAWVKAIREADGLDESEAELMIRRIGYYGQKYARKLSEHFSAELL